LLFGESIAGELPHDWQFDYETFDGSCSQAREPLKIYKKMVHPFSCS
jgi:hypothetical protein